MKIPKATVHPKATRRSLFKSWCGRHTDDIIGVSIILFILGGLGTCIIVVERRGTESQRVQKIKDNAYELKVAEKSRDTLLQAVKWQEKHAPEARAFCSNWSEYTPVIDCEMRHETKSLRLITCNTEGCWRK